MSNQQQKTKESQMPMIFQLLGLAMFGLLSYMGLNYAFYGNLWVAAPISLLSIIILFILVNRMIYFKSQKQNIVDYKPEIALGVIYAVIAIFFMIYHNHYISIDFGKKDEIKKAGLDKVKELENLKLAYETEINNKISTLNTTVKTNFNNLMTAERGERPALVMNLKEVLGKGVDEAKLLNQPNSAAAEVEDAKKKKEKTIQQTYEQTNLHKEYEEYSEKAKKTFENWNRNKISYYYNDIDKMYETMYKAYKDKMKEFNYKDKIKSAEINITNSFKNLQNTSFSMIFIVIVVSLITNLLIFAPYIAKKRDEPDGGRLIRNNVNDKNIQGNIRIN